MCRGVIVAVCMLVVCTSLPSAAGASSADHAISSRTCPAMQYHCDATLSVSCAWHSCPAPEAGSVLRRLDVMLEHHFWGQRDARALIRQSLVAHLSKAAAKATPLVAAPRNPTVWHFVGRSRSGKTSLARKVGAAMSSRIFESKECALLSIQADDYMEGFAQARNHLRSVVLRQLRLQEKSVFVFNDMHQDASLTPLVEMLVDGVCSASLPPFFHPTNSQSIVPHESGVTMGNSILILTSDFGGAFDSRGKPAPEIAHLTEASTWEEERHAVRLLATRRQQEFSGGTAVSGKALVVVFRDALEEEAAKGVEPALLLHLLRRDIVCASRHPGTTELTLSNTDATFLLQTWKREARSPVFGSVTVQELQNQIVQHIDGIVAEQRWQHPVGKQNTVRIALSLHAGQHPAVEDYIKVNVTVN